MSIIRIFSISFVTIAFLISATLFSSTDTASNLASVIKTNTNPSQGCIDKINTDNGTDILLTDVEIRKVNLNSDRSADYIVKKISDKGCGTAGCIFELCITKNREVTVIPFGYAANKLDVKNTLTNGMYDIQLTGQSTNNLQWDGTRYIVLQ